LSYTNVVNVLIETFGIASISSVEKDIKLFMAKLPPLLNEKEHKGKLVPMDLTRE